MPLKQQRTPEWHYAKLGIVSASRFKDCLSSPSIAGVFSIEGERGSWSVLQNGEIVSEGHERKADAEKAKKIYADAWREMHWSSNAYKYAAILLAELWTGMPRQNFQSAATDWGEENEPEAFLAAIPVIQERFGMRLDMPVDEYAFILHPTEAGIGCSPDGIIGDTGLLEIKCPYDPSKWVERKIAGLSVPNEYVPQIQGSLWVTGRQWYAFVYYDGRMVNGGLDPLQITRVERNDRYIDNVLAPRVLAFRDLVHRLDGEHRKIREPF